MVNSLLELKALISASCDKILLVGSNPTLLPKKNNLISEFNLLNRAWFFKSDFFYSFVTPSRGGVRSIRLILKGATTQQTCCVDPIGGY